MIHLATLIALDKKSDRAYYRQVSDGIIALIRRGILAPGTRIQGTREVATGLRLHRKTVVSAYQELVDEAWIESRPRKGYYICKQLPDADPKKLFEGQPTQHYPAATRFKILASEHPLLREVRLGEEAPSTINDGFPDLRLFPLKDFAREYQSIVHRKSARKYFGYSSMQGSLNLRNELVRHLAQTRGLQLSNQNILITKGAQMAIHIAASMVIKRGDHIAVGEPGYFVANLAFKNIGANLCHVPVDEHGMRIDALEKLSRRKKISMVYCIPHHHHPTTVTLSSDRRLQLLDFAASQKIAIIEDDYDFDIHYQGSPVLPMASYDRYGNVIYVGTLSKVLAPAIRIGFMVAPENFIQAASRQKFLMDLQGDTLLEETIASMYKNGLMDRHLKKSRKIYAERRDLFCGELSRTLADRVSFAVPDGGMSVWVTFNSADTASIATAAARQGLSVNNGKRFNTGDTDHNAMRLGFASLNAVEIKEAIRKLALAVRAAEKK